MKITLVVKGPGGNDPVLKLNGAKFGTYTFIFDRALQGHALSYEIPRELEEFKRDSVDLLPLQVSYPILAVVSEVEGAAVDAVHKETLDRLAQAEERCLEYSVTITERDAEIERLKKITAENSVTIGNSLTEIIDLKAALEAAEKRGGAGAGEEFEKSQGGEEASRRAHNSESAGSSPAPGTTSTQETPAVPPAGEPGDTPAPEGDADPAGETMTPSEAGKTLGNGIPEKADAEAGKVLAAQAKNPKKGGTKKGK